MKPTFSEFYKIKTLTEQTHEIVKIDLDECDVIDLADLILRVAAHFEYKDLKKKRDRYNDTTDKNDEDYEEFDFTPDALADKMQDFMKHLADRLEDVSSLSHIKGVIKNEFSDVKEPK